MLPIQLPFLSVISFFTGTQFRRRIERKKLQKEKYRKTVVQNGTERDALHRHVIGSATFS
jgi:hypothetical protein